MKAQTSHRGWRIVQVALGGGLGMAFVGAFEGAVTGAILGPMVEPHMSDARQAGACIGTVIAAATGLFAGIPAFAIAGSIAADDEDSVAIIIRAAAGTVIGVGVGALIGSAVYAVDNSLGTAIYFYGVILGFIVGTYWGAIRAARTRRPLSAPMGA